MCPITSRHPVNILNLGRFLLATLHLNSLKTKLSVNETRACLDTLPSNVKGAYDQAMDRAVGKSNAHADLARKVMAWVFKARRPFLRSSSNTRSHSDLINLFRMKEALLLSKTSWPCVPD